MDIHIEPSQGSKPLECPKCEYTCKYENILSAHLETHTGERCSRSDISELVRKGRSANNEDGLIHENEMPLSCTECVFKCMNKDILFSHLKSHNVYACITCDIRYNSLRELAGHSKIHKQKQFKCTKCEYNVNTLTKLNTHMRSHTGEKVTGGSLSSLDKSPSSKITHLITNPTKRGLSVSPEAVDTNKKSARNSNNSKKSKT